MRHLIQFSVLHRWFHAERYALSPFITVLCLITVTYSGVALPASTSSSSGEALPNSVSSGPQDHPHVQGITVDVQNGFIYYSFTNTLLKTDRRGKLIGSVTGINGHLGDLTFDPKTNTIYAALQCKGGRTSAILKQLSEQRGSLQRDATYIAIFDAGKIICPDMDMSETDVMKAAYVPEVVADCEATVKQGDKEFPHRHGCWGIDGMTLGPVLGDDHSSPNDCLYIAYAVWGDLDRDDNDNQVILQYDRRVVDEAARHLDREHPHTSEPKTLRAKYFLYTGNTTYGIQNLEYDAHSGCFFIAVYRGRKSQFPNYGLFAFDSRQTPHSRTILYDNASHEVDSIDLLDAGQRDEKTGIRGWVWTRGATGMSSLGDGLFYFSSHKRVGDKNVSLIQKFKWIGGADSPFEVVE